MMGDRAWAREAIEQQQSHDRPLVATQADGTPRPQLTSYLEQMHKRNTQDHGYMMLFGTNPESQPLRYFYLLHALETLVVARFAPRGMLTLENIATLRRVATPINWDYDAWTARVNAVHAEHARDAGVARDESVARLNAGVAAAIHEFTERTPIQAAFKDKKMREDVLFFTMLTYLDDLLQYWVSGAPGAPRILDPPTFTDFMLRDRRHCISVKTMIALMLYGRKRDRFASRALSMLGGESGPLRAHARPQMSSLADQVIYTPCKDPPPVASHNRAAAGASYRGAPRHHQRHQQPEHDSAESFADTFDFDAQQSAETARVASDTPLRSSRHTDHHQSTRDFDMLFGSEVPHTHFARIMEMRTVDMGLVELHLASKYCSQVCCFESVAHVARARRAADTQRQERERKRLVQKSGLALQ